MNAALRVTCIGLTHHEQGLLSQQLKMLKGRTAHLWECIGDAAGGELVIRREQSDRSNRAAALLQAVGNQASISIEWPLRMFGLMELLLDCEKRLAQSAPAAPVSALASCELLAALDTRLLHGVPGVLLIVPREDVLLSRHATFAQALQDLSESCGRLQTFPPAAQADDVELMHRHSFKSLLWSLALAQGAPAGGHWQQAAATFHLQAWPLLSEWQSSPPLLRLAALYTRQFVSVERGVAFSGATASQVRAFLFACKCCGIGLESRVHMPQKTLQAPVETSLLQRLRKRLGLGYGRSGKT